MNKKGVYSIWLVPEGEVLAKYCQLIKTLADEFSASAFEPHITIVPDYSGDLEDIKSRISNALSGYLFPLQVSLTGPHIGESYYRCVYHLADKTPELDRVYSLIRGQFGGQSDYFPHLSLIYGNFSLQIRKQISRRADELSLQLHLPMSFPVNHVTIYNTGALVESADRIASWRFSTKIP